MTIPTRSAGFANGAGGRPLIVGEQVLTPRWSDGNGGEYIVLAVTPPSGVASPGDGRCFLRVGDTCNPIRHPQKVYSLKGSV